MATPMLTAIDLAILKLMEKRMAILTQMVRLMLTAIDLVILRPKERLTAILTLMARLTD